MRSIVRVVAAVALLGAAPLVAKERPGRGGAEVQDSFDSEPAAGTMARCAVTGDSFRVNAETIFVRHNGRVYAFCCEDCAEQFKANPSKFGA